MEKRSRIFDIPIDGAAAHYATIEELVESYKSFTFAGDYENALDASCEQ